MAGVLQESVMSELAAIVSLGCAKNLVDSETLAPQLLNCGYALTSKPAEATLIVINSCGFLENAVQEAIQVTLECAACKQDGKCRELILAGCMVQRYGKKLPGLLPEVDVFLGASHYLELETILKKRRQGDTRKLWLAAPRHLPDSRTPRLRSTPGHTAYLKIAEGCGNRCSFCKIPQLRGPYRSRSVEDVCREAFQLAAEGVKELNLIAQDTTAFGLDRGDESALVRLLENLDQVPGIEWVRLLYTYPDRVDLDLLRTMAQANNIVPYLDLPLQHCVPGILRRMRRSSSVVEVRALLESIRSVLPDISLRTSMIVGFPGETEADFEELLHFVEGAEFAHLGAFAYSPEPGTQAARYPQQIDERVKEERRNALLAVQKKVSRRRLRRLIGKTAPILIEGPHPETDLLLIGRLAGQAPEVDGCVIITKGEGQIGQIVQGRITRAYDYDLEAELIGNCAEVSPPSSADNFSGAVGKTL